MNNDFENTNEIKVLEIIKNKIQGKIDTEDLLVACEVIDDPDIIENWIQYENFGKEFHKITVNPKRSLVMKIKYNDCDRFVDIPSFETIRVESHTNSFYCTSNSRGSSREVTKGYLMSFKEYISKKLGITINTVTLKQAKLLLKLTNIGNIKRFVLNEDYLIASEQINRKVYMNKKNKK